MVRTLILARPSSKTFWRSKKHESAERHVWNTSSFKNIQNWRFILIYLPRCGFQSSSSYAAFLPLRDHTTGSYSLTFCRKLWGASLPQWNKRWRLSINKTDVLFIKWIDLNNVSLPSPSSVVILCADRYMFVLDEIDMIQRALSMKPSSEQALPSTSRR